MKKILFKPQFLGILIFILFDFFIYSSCNKQDVSVKNSLTKLTEDSKKYYNEVVVQRENSMLATPYSELPSYSGKRKFARMANIGKIIDWSHAKEYNYHGEQFVVAPIIDEKRPFKFQEVEAARGLVFYLNESGKMQMNMVEILSKKNGKIISQPVELIAKAFINKRYDKHQAIENESASFHFYDEAYGHLFSYQAEGGEWTKTNNSIRNKLGAPKIRSTPTMIGRTTCQTCQHYYLVGIWYNTSTGQIVDAIILSEWDECTEGTPPEGYGSWPNVSSPDSQEACFLAATSDWDQQVAAAYVSNEVEGFDVSTIDNFKKEKNPKWKPLQSVFWYLRSTEKGVVELIDIPTNKWQWNSLVHDKLDFIGTSFGGGTEIYSHNGTPSFVAGTPNVLYAGMNLEIVMKYTPNVINCPPFTWVIPPAYVPYTANCLWPAIP